MTAQPVSIEIYGKKSCPHCEQTKNYLDSRSIPYKFTYVDQPGNESLPKKLKSQGFRQLPVVFVRDRVLYKDIDSWQGYQEDKLEKTASDYRDSLVEDSF